MVAVAAELLVLLRRIRAVAEVDLVQAELMELPVHQALLF
jgi:hypothetical protein